MKDGRYTSAVIENVFHLNLKKDLDHENRRPRKQLSRGESVKLGINKIEHSITGGKRQRQYLHTNAAPTVDIGVLIEQFLVHLFFPFTVPYVRAKYGDDADKVQMFTLKSGGIFAVSYYIYFIYPIIFFIFQERKIWVSTDNRCRQPPARLLTHTPPIPLLPHSPPTSSTPSQISTKVA